MHAETGKKEYRIERLGKGNLDDLDRLYRAVHGKAWPPGYYQKKYNTSYTGAEYLGYFAYNDQGLAIAYYGVTPCFLQYKRDLLLAAQAVDAMTHPEYRNRGLLAELCNLTIDLCRQSSILLVFGFPNQHSYPSFVNRLGWISTGRLEYFALPVPTIPLASAAQRYGLLKRPYMAWRRAFLKGRLVPLAGIAGPAANGQFGGIYRDDAYLQYKRYSVGTQVIRVGTALAWVRIQQDLAIGDLSLEGQDFETTINALKRIAAWLGIRRLYFHSNPGTPLHRQFASRYSPIPSFPIIFMDLGAGIPLDELKFTFADIDTF
jgi:hypothetical protein